LPDLIAEIRLTADRFRDRVNDLHDDYTHTRQLWQAQLIRAGVGGGVDRVFNPITRNVIATGAELSARARSAQARLRIRAFKDLTAEFELFLDEFLRIWLSHHTDLIAGKGVTVEMILASQDLAALQAASVSAAVEATISDKLKGRPDSWLRYLRDILGAAIAAADAGAFVELKARRDVLEHHSGIVDASYPTKCGPHAKYQQGARVDIVEADIDEVHAVVLRLIDVTAAAAVAKLTPPPSS
jgi:hypothetical protein